MHTTLSYINEFRAVADPGGGPGPVKTSDKKDGRQRRPHKFHVSCPPPYPAAGSDAAEITVI